MSELQELKRIGARPQPNSGRGKHNKGDGVLDEKWIVDVKEYEKSYGLSVTSWGKVCTDASKSNFEPLLAVVLGSEGERRIRLMVQDQDDWLEMKEKARLYDELTQEV